MRNEDPTPIEDRPEVPESGPGTTMNAKGGPRRRIAAIDWMRGIVMVLMALDHTSMFFNEGRVSGDSAAAVAAGGPFAPEQFFARFVTHLCAPTFVFLAGTAIAISTVQRRERGMSDRAIDRDLLIRGAFIAFLDLVVMSPMSGKVLLQVLYAIGVSMMLMVPLRRIGARGLLGLSLVLLVGGEALTGLLWDRSADSGPLWVSLTFAPHFGRQLVVLYPALPWLGMMILGWVFGERLAAPSPTGWPKERWLAAWGLAALALFVVVRGLDGYGNMFLHRDDGSIMEWLHVSKYPPALAYSLLELGLMALLLAGLMRLEKHVDVRKNGPILVFGQTALFFYLVHFGLLAALRAFVSPGGLGLAALVLPALLVVLYPMCRAYRTLKVRHPRSVLRFV